MKKIMNLILTFIFSIAFLEIFIRVIDKNCYSILPFYFDENHSSMLKNEEYCVKYKGHPYAIYKTNKFGIRINAVAPGNILFKGSVWETKLKKKPLEILA